MALVFMLSAQILPVEVSILAALIARILLTGALHEDGFADFCDGFGGGTSRQRTLEIMKDSHIGTYGVLGLIGYFLLFYSVLKCLILQQFTAQSSIMDAAMLMVLFDVIAKGVSSYIVDLLPYARNAEEAKNKLVYNVATPWEHIIRLLFLVTAVFLYASAFPGHLPILIAPIIVFCILVLWIRQRIEGYTGDCCGAMFISVEFSLYLALLIGW